jgi:hypothetical protein
MSIIDDYLLYMDDIGLVHDKIGQISQNGIRFTAEYLFALKRAGQLDTYNKLVIFNAYLDCEPTKGLLNRYPGNTDQEGPDDQYAALAVSKELHSDFAKDFLAYGRQAPVLGYDAMYDRQRWFSVPLMALCRLLGYKYVYNNHSPGYFNESAWMGRQPALIAHAMVCAGEPLNVFWRLAWCAGILLSANNASSQDGKVLAWFMVKASQGSRSWLMQKAVNLWIRKLKEQWPHGIGQVLQAYFVDKNQPSISHLWDEFGLDCA